MKIKITIVIILLLALQTEEISMFKEMGMWKIMKYLQNDTKLRLAETKIWELDGKKIGHKERLGFHKNVIYDPRNAIHINFKIKTK